MNITGMQTWANDNHPSTDGPWADEPDKAHWIDETTGLDCLIVRNQSGALCGYVGISPDHPYHGLDYWGPVGDLDVHGGVTFAAECRPGEDPSVGICHVPQEGRPDDLWWIGFDCAHAFDLQPSLDLFLETLTASSDAISGVTGEGTAYRDFAYVQSECSSLASQLAAVADGD